MKKRISVSLLLPFLVLAMFLTACEKKDDVGKDEALKTEEKAKNLNTEEKYEPVTITVDLERSGLGTKIEQTFTEPPKGVVARGDQMADYFFDLGLEDNMVGYTHGFCHSLVSQYPARDEVPLLGGENGNFGKEELLSVGCDFLVGWDSTFSDKNFNKDFCQSNGIAMYTPYCTTDFATFEDIFKDYEVLGKIFNVEEKAAEKVEAMKKKLQYIENTIGKEAYDNPANVFVFDSGGDDAFTACQGMPGDILRLAGGKSIFDDINKGWARVSWEQVVKRNPEVILVLDYNGEAEEKIDFIHNSEALKDLDAVKNKRIIVANAADMQGSAGSAGTVEIIAKGLYPEKF